MSKILLGTFTLWVVFLTSCFKTDVIPKKPYKTKNVILIVMDGSRYSETWGDSNHLYIPNISTYIAPKGVVDTSFYNNMYTWTSPGHLALLSGKYYNLDNGGNELPPFPTIFQYFKKSYPNKVSWIVSSKDKLEVLNNSSDVDFNNLFLCNTNCGVNGLGTGYRTDSITMNVAMDVLLNNHPNLALISFREPDFTAHQNDSLGYLNEISRVDSMIHIIYSFFQTNAYYKNSTTVFITNDHGRHDDLNGGFSGHGDNCNGCRHIMFFATGPDFYENKIIGSYNEQIDLAPTIAELLHFDLPYSDGKVMDELFK